MALMQTRHWPKIDAIIFDSVSDNYSSYFLAANFFLRSKVLHHFRCLYSIHASLKFPPFLQVNSGLIFLIATMFLNYFFTISLHFCLSYLIPAYYFFLGYMPFFFYFFIFWFRISLLFTMISILHLHRLDILLLLHLVSLLLSLFDTSRFISYTAALPLS